MIRTIWDVPPPSDLPPGEYRVEVRRVETAPSGSVTQHLVWIVQPVPLLQVVGWVDFGGAGMTGKGKTTRAHLRVAGEHTTLCQTRIPPVIRRALSGQAGTSASGPPLRRFFPVTEAESTGRCKRCLHFSGYWPEMQ